MVHLTTQDIKHAIQAYRVDFHQRYQHVFTSDDMKNLRHAAVIIPMFEHEDRWHVLLTQRSEALVEHRGQVAFPGGARERGDQDLQATALREMQEEIGVQPGDVEVFGHLGDMPVVTGYLVRPYVGRIPWPYTLDISSDEVQSAFHVPLEWLADPKNRYSAYRSYAGREFPVVYFQHYNGYQLWGASAEMALALLSALHLIE